MTATERQRRPARHGGPIGGPARGPGLSSRPPRYRRHCSRSARPALNDSVGQSQKGRDVMTTLQAPATATERAATAPATRYVLAMLRIALGWIFLWAFLDKLFGLGHETTEKAAWINGGSPTKGFLANAATGPF